MGTDETLTPWKKHGSTQTLTDDIHHPDDTEDRSDDHQHALKACEHALDALRDDDLSHARALLDESTSGRRARPA